MPISEILTWLALIAGGLIALGVIWTKGLRPLYGFLRRIEDVHQLIIEELPVHMSEVKDFMSTTRAWQTDTDRLTKQLKPNSGSSLFDRVVRIERVVNSQPQTQINITDTGATPHVNGVDIELRGVDG